jgi:AcrR family transcriptional regulator
MKKRKKPAMIERANSDTAGDDKTASHPDGRRKRSQSSRKKIVAAMLKLVAEGDVAPSAARIATAAGVGERTIFRHFEDLDILFQEMSAEIEDKVLPELLRPYTQTDWKNQLQELLERRVAFHEKIMPYRISGNVKRFRSVFLMQDYRRFMKLERDSIEAILPAIVRADKVRARAIQVALSFYSWQLLRQDEELNVHDAKAVVKQMLSDILAQLQT